MTLEIMDEARKDDGGIKKSEVRFLMSGSTQVTPKQPNPTGESGWLSDNQWCAIEELAEKFSDSFDGLDRDFERHIHEWEKIYNQQAPQAKENLANWPGKWSALEMLLKINVLRVIRPDKVVEAIQELIEGEIGRTYLIPPSFDMG